MIGILHRPYRTFVGGWGSGVGGGGGVWEGRGRCICLLGLLLLLSHFSRVRLCVTHRRQPSRLPCPWDSPGKNTGVGCPFLLQCTEVKSESEVAQLCPTLRDPMDCSPPGSSIHGIFQARVLEWGAITFSVARAIIAEFQKLIGLDIRIYFLTVLEARSPRSVC